MMIAIMTGGETPPQQKTPDREAEGFIFEQDEARCPELVEGFGVRAVFYQMRCV
jgi:hypothetical protein